MGARANGLREGVIRRRRIRLTRSKRNCKRYHERYCHRCRWQLYIASSVIWRKPNLFFYWIEDCRDHHWRAIYGRHSTLVGCNTTIRSSCNWHRNGHREEETRDLG